MNISTKRKSSLSLLSHIIETLTSDCYHYVKSVQLRCFFWFVFSCIRTEYKNIRTRKNSVVGHFSRSVYACQVFQGFHQKIGQETRYRDQPEKICDVSRNLVTFAKFKKREKHPWRSVTYSKVADF